MTDNIKYPAPLKTLREGAQAMVTKGDHTGRFVEIVGESSYVNYKVIWRVSFKKKKLGDDLYPTFNEDMLMCVQHPYASTAFNGGEG